MMENKTFSGCQIFGILRARKLKLVLIASKKRMGTRKCELLEDSSHFSEKSGKIQNWLEY